MRSSIYIISIIVFWMIFIELTKALNYDWSDSELTWFYIFGFGCLISGLLFAIFSFKFVDCLEKYMENLSKR